MKNVALITGASSGIGKEFAYIHAAKKGDLILVARREDKLKKIQEEISNKYGVVVQVIVKDLTSMTAPQEIYDELKAANITIDYLINNAGFGGHGKFHERAWLEDQRMIQLNILALTALTRLFLPDMVAKNSGKILNVSSTASLLPGPLQAVYFATKAYVTSFSNAIAEELNGTNITVTALLPGATETEFAKASGLDKTDLFKKAFTAKSVAEEGYKAMLKGKLNALAGITFSQKMMMKMLPLMPKRTVMKMVRKMQETK